MVSGSTRYAASQRKAFCFHRCATPKRRSGVAEYQIKVSAVVTVLGAYTVLIKNFELSSAEPAAYPPATQSGHAACPGFCVCSCFCVSSCAPAIEAARSTGNRSVLI